MGLIGQVARASGRTDDDTVFQWVKEAADTTKIWDDSLESGESFATLDFKVADALLAFFRDDRSQANDQSQKIYVITI